MLAFEVLFMNFYVAVVFIIEYDLLFLFSGLWSPGTLNLSTFKNFTDPLGKKKKDDPLESIVITEKTKKSISYVAFKPL